jgi:hypothetical protein
MNAQFWSTPETNATARAMADMQSTAAVIKGGAVYVTPAGSVLWRHKFGFKDVEQLDSSGATAMSPKRIVFCDPSRKPGLHFVLNPADRACSD